MATQGYVVRVMIDALAAAIGLSSDDEIEFNREHAEKIAARARAGELDGW